MEESVIKSDGEVDGASSKRHCTVLQKIETYAEAIQSLVTCHEKQEKTEELGNQICDNDECGSSALILAIAGYAENIRKAIYGRKLQLQLIPSSALPQNTADQENDPLKDANGSREKALNNSLVLRTIMSHLNGRDLLRLRLVNKKWKEESTIQLLSTCSSNKLCKFHKVSFKWIEDAQKFRNKLGTLKEFEENCYDNELGKFPCSQFRFSIKCGTKFEMKKVPADLFNFLSKHGQDIKIMGLLMSKNSISAFKIIRQILSWTPSLQSLTLDFPLNEWPENPDGEDDGSDSDDDIKHSSVSLKDLQELIFEAKTSPNPMNMIAPESFKGLVRDILAGAPKLKRISDPFLWFIKEIVSSKKTRAVQHLSLENSGESPVMMNNLIDFSRAAPQLTSLKSKAECFSPGFPKMPHYNFLSSLQRILESSKRTLKTLHLGTRLTWAGENYKMDFPVMENLEEFCLEEWNEFQGGRGKILPPGFTLQVSFPRLKNLSLLCIGNQEELEEDEEEGGDMIDNPFGYTCNTSTTVERLTISTKKHSLLDPHWLCHACIFYPNVRVLHLELRRGWWEFFNICSTIWNKWKDSLLEELHISRHNWDCGCEEDLTAEMDHIFTGFDKEACRRLRKQRDTEKVQEELKRGPAIVDMDKLKLFKLTCKVSRGSCPLFSRVSVIHAFDPMRKRQNLKVVINETELEDMIHERNVDFGRIVDGLDEGQRAISPILMLPGVFFPVF